jgi:murein tripeptide amidase MpaA
MDHCAVSDPLLPLRHKLTKTSTIEYVAQQLVQGYKSGDNVTQAFLNNYDFYIFPFVNPDGMWQRQCDGRV